MQIKVTNDGGNAVVQVIDPSDGTVTHNGIVGEGEQYVVVATTAHSPADIEVYGPEKESESTAPAVGEGAPAEAADAGAPAEGDAAPDASGEAEASATGDAGASGDASGEAGAVEGEATTSEASQLPLYRVLADEVPDGFVPSGLETPDGFTLYHYNGDVAGESYTADIGDESQVALYADADDNEQPVVPAAGDAGESA